MSHPNKRESLLTQLENMHKQLNDETKRKSDENDNSAGSRNSRRKQPLFSNVLSRSDRTNSMPMFAGSSSHNGLISSNNSQDMNFVMGLSENLLVECRRLQADNERKARKFKTIKQSYEDLKLMKEELENTHQVAAKELQTLRDENWQLEGKLQNSYVEFKNQKEKLLRSKRDRKQEAELLRKSKEDLEAASLQRTKLEEQLETDRTKLSAEIADLKNHVSDLNDENDSLHLKNQQLNDQLEDYKQLRVMQPSEYDFLQKEAKLARQFRRRAMRKVRAAKGDARLMNSESNHSNTDNKHDYEDSEEDISDSQGIMDTGVDVDLVIDDLTLVDVEKYAKNHNLVVLSNDAFEDLQRLEPRNSDSHEQIIRTVEESDIVALPNDESSVKTPNKSRDLEHMINLLKSSGYDVIPEVQMKEIQEKAQSYDHPTLQYLETRLKDQGKQAISTNDFRLLKNPPHSQLISELEQRGYKVLLDTDHMKLIESLEHPTLEEIQNKLKLLEYIAVPFKEYESIKAPGLVAIGARAKALGHTVVPEQKYQQLQESLADPSISFLKDNISKSPEKLDEITAWITERRNEVLLDKSVYQELKSSFDKPAKELLMRKAALEGCELVEKSEYEELNEKLRKPSYEYLKDKASAINCKIMPISEFHELSSLLENPTEEFLSCKAEQSGCRVVRLDEFERLVHLEKSPDINFLSTKANDLEYQLIKNETYKALLSNSSDPDIEFVREKANLRGYELVEKGLYKEMLRKTLNPKKDEIEVMAETLGYVLVSASELERMKTRIENPSIQYLTDKAKKLDFVLISEEEKKKLSEKNSNKASLFSAVKTLGFIPVAVGELASLKNVAINNVSLPQIQERLRVLGYIAIKTEQHETLNKPVTDTASRHDAIAICSKYDLKPISLTEYESLKRYNDNLKSEDEYISKLESRGYAVIPRTKYECFMHQLESPELEDLMNNSEKMGHVVIKKDDYQKQVRILQNPSADFLQEKAISLGFALVEQKEFETLQRTFESPSLEFLQQKARAIQRELVTLEEIRSKIEQLDHPSLSYLADKAAEYDKSLIDRKILDDIQRKATAPTTEELKASCDGLGLTLLAKDKYAKICQRANNPILSELKDKMSKLGYYSLPSDEYDNLLKNYNDPTDDYLAAKALSKGKKLVNKTFYESLQQQLQSPTQDFLAKHAANLHMKLVSDAEYVETKALLTSPSRQHLEEKADALELQIIPKIELEKIKKQAENPPFDTMRKALADLGFLPIQTSEYERLKHQLSSLSVEQISELAEYHGYILVYSKAIVKETDKGQENFSSIIKSGSYVLLEKESYDLLSDSSMGKKSKKEVIDSCSEFGMIPIPCDKYEELTQVPDLAKIRTLAAQHGSLIVLREEYDLLSAEAECPSEELIQKSASQKGLAVVNKAEYSSLMSRLENPTKHEVERQAKKLNLIAVPSEKYYNLINELKSKSASTTPSPSSKVLASKQYFEQVIRDQNEHSDKLYEPAKTLGFVKISSEEYKKLKENQQSHILTKADVYNGAKMFSLSVLPLEEYKALLKRKSTSLPFDYEDLEEYAAKLNLKLVPIGLYGSESPTPLHRTSLETGAGDFLKFNDHSSCMTNESSSTQGDNHVDAPQSTSTLLKRQLTDSSSTSSRFTDALDDNIECDISDAVSIASTVLVSNHAENKELDSLRKKAGHLGYRLVSLSKYPEGSEGQEVALLLESVASDVDSSSEHNNNDREVIKLAAQRIGYSILPQVEYEELQKVKNLKPERETLEVMARDIGFVIVREDEYNELLEGAGISSSRVQELATRFGLKAVPDEHIKQLEYEIEKERLTAENIAAKAHSLGYVALSGEQYEKLKTQSESNIPMMTKERIMELASSFGLMVTSLDENQECEINVPNKEKDIKEELAVKSRSLGLVLLENDTYQQLLHNSQPCGGDVQQTERGSSFSAEDVINLASEFELVCMKREQFEQIKDELTHPTLTKEEIMKQAAELDLLCIPKADYTRLKLTFGKGGNGSNEQKESNDGEVCSNNGAEKDCNRDLATLQAIATKLRLFRTPKDPAGSSGGVVREAVKQLVVLPAYYFDELLEKNRTLDLKLREEKHSEDREISLTSTPEKQTFRRPPSIGSPAVDKLGSQNSYRLLAIGARNNSIEGPTMKALRTPKSPVQSPKAGPKHSRNPSLITRNDSIISSMKRTGSMDAISLATVASLSEPSIIPALTQTVIGEYLYKYYPYLGQFGLNSRHERFFWVHPYTLTLYWSTTNPIMANPSSHKTKCAAILAVDSVVDTNPYPAGLYHKSIIVRSEKKTVKITCPTRQRHNIWYNSLRYLIQRNMEGINLEDTADDPSDTMYSGKIFPLPGENAKNTSRRLLSSRKSIRSKIPKSASMPVKRRS